MTLCWAVFTLWFAASLWGFLQPSSGGPALLSQLLLLLFVAVHGYLSYGWRGTAAYVLIAGGVSMLMEVTSVNFGFPFGFYTHYTGQVLGVPFGVPLTNYLGWLLNGFVFYQLFAFVEDRFAPPNRAALSLPGYWLMPCLVTVTPVLRFIIAYLGAPEGTASVEGRTFLISDIYESAIIASLMTVVFAALIAVVRIYSVKADGATPAAAAADR